MDDGGLTRLISNLPAKSIALMEDIDVAFTQGVNRQSPPTPAPMPTRNDGFGFAQSAQQTSAGGITLSGLLNAIDGVAAQEGRILFATTNQYSVIDPALKRPGRLDLHIEFRLSTQVQAKELFERFYPANIGSNAHSVQLGKQQLSEHEDKIDLEKPPSYTAVTGGISSPYELSASELAKLAKEFASQIPEEELSMAALQGHLMRYKTRPHEAVSATTAWVEDERGQKQTWESSNGNTDREMPSLESNAEKEAE